MAVTQHFDGSILSGRHAWERKIYKVIVTLKNHTVTQAKFQKNLWVLDISPTQANNGRDSTFRRKRLIHLISIV